MKFAWTTLRVSDLERSIAFYRDVLGLHPMARMGTDAHRVVMFGPDGTTKLELIWEAAPIPENAGIGVSMGFIPDDLDAFMSRMAELGIPAVGPVSPSSDIRFYFIRDPDGYTIQLVERR